MTKLTYTKPHRPGQLGDELIAAFPEWIELIEGRRFSRFTLSSAGDTITLDVPDDVNVPAVGAIVAAHAPTVPPAPPAAPSAAQLAALRDFMAGTQPATIAQLAAVVRTFVQLYRYRTGRDD